MTDESIQLAEGHIIAIAPCELMSSLKQFMWWGSIGTEVDNEGSQVGDMARNSWTCISFSGAFMA